MSFSVIVTAVWFLN